MRPRTKYCYLMLLSLLCKSLKASRLSLASQLWDLGQRWHHDPVKIQSYKVIPVLKTYRSLSVSFRINPKYIPQTPTALCGLSACYQAYSILLQLPKTPETHQGELQQQKCWSPCLKHASFRCLEVWSPYFHCSLLKSHLHSQLILYFKYCSKTSHSPFCT